jgi:hypothetical protein
MVYERRLSSTIDGGGQKKALSEHTDGIAQVIFGLNPVGEILFPLCQTEDFQWLKGDERGSHGDCVESELRSLLEDLMGQIGESHDKLP